MRKVVMCKFTNQLQFTNHIEEICKKTLKKLNELARLAPCMGISKWRTLMRFLSCSLTHLFHMHSFLYPLETSENHKVF